MRSHSLSIVSLFALLAACSQHSPSMSVMPEELQEPFVSPAFRMVPEVWETAGSEMTPHLELVNGPASEAMRFVFAYEGSGFVQVPKGASVAAGETEFQFDGTFSSDSSDVETMGTVEVILIRGEDEFENVQIGEWSVLHRPSIVHEVQSLRVDPLQNGMLYACLVAVDYDPMASGTAPPEDRGEWIQIEAEVKPQGNFHPRAFVNRGVDADDFSGLPRNFKFDGERMVFYVDVERPSYPQMRRAYLTVTVGLGGDEHRIHVALPNR